MATARLNQSRSYRPLFVRENIDALREWRGRKCLTRSDTAAAIGVNKDYLAQWERGDCYPTQDNYNKLAKVFGWEEWK